MWGGLHCSQKMRELCGHMFEHCQLLKVRQEFLQKHKDLFHGWTARFTQARLCRTAINAKAVLPTRVVIGSDDCFGVDSSSAQPSLLVLCSGSCTGRCWSQHTGLVLACQTLSV